MNIIGKKIIYSIKSIKKIKNIYYGKILDKCIINGDTNYLITNELKRCNTEIISACDIIYLSQDNENISDIYYNEENRSQLNYCLINEIVELIIELISQKILQIKDLDYYQGKFGLLYFNNDLFNFINFDDLNIIKNELNNKLNNKLKS